MDVDEPGRAVPAEPPTGETSPGPVATGPDPVADATPTARPRRRRWRKLALIALVLVVGLAGSVLAAGTYVLDHVTMGDPVRLPATTTLYYADGTVMASVPRLRFVI